MESSRRPPFDRSRELNSLKKPRFSGEDPRRPSPASTGNSPAIAARATAGRLQTNALQQLKQFQELVNQYKTALAELTFNSKPIITNLTIIAGENLQAARAISATICDHILEVPSEQKLPSLYLLDSIVKNIGRDYIKYFATRLPEVFCLAYKQVDPSIHSGMRHLFGTWKGVFPLQQLQFIEAELGFGTAVNGSSSGSAPSKTDTQTQRQSQSIHVNPKYLQARQHLQQSSPPKVMDTNGIDVGSSEDVERPNRISLQKPRGTAYGGYDFASGVKRPLSTLAGKSFGQGNEKRWLGASGEAEESISTQRNGYDIKHGISNYTGARATSPNVPLLQNPPGSGIEMSKSWKNSEEEEYKWDDLGNRATDPGVLDKLELITRSSKWQSQNEIRSPSEPKEMPFGQSRSITPSVQHVGTRSLVGLSNLGVQATAASGAKSFVGQHNPTGQPVGHQRPPPPVSKRDPRQSLIKKGLLKSQTLARTDPREASVSGQPKAGLRDLPSRLQNSQPGNLPKLQSQTSLKLPSTSEQSHYVPSSQQLPNPEADLSRIVQKAQQVQGSSPMNVTSPGSSDPLIGKSHEQLNVSNLLAAVMKSGLLTSGSSTGQLGTQSPATSRGASIPSGHRDSVSLSESKRVVEKSPLPPGLSSSLPFVTSTSAQISEKASGNSNPLSILSTLISKGLISAPKTEEIAPTPTLSENPLAEQSPTVATDTSITVPSVLKSSSDLPTLTNAETSSSEPAGKTPGILVTSTKANDGNLIGFEFKPPVLREFHSAVVDRLSEDLPHRCTLCGLRFKLEETLAKHSEWHALKSSLENCLNPPSRRWYSNTTDWVAGSVGFPFGYNSNGTSVESSSAAEHNEKMVPADESQCVCLLCGELFEDFYSEERGEWMFKGAVYIPSMSGSTETGPSYENDMHNMIVHCTCMSDDSVRELGLFSGVKVEKNA
ncbi:hypothetical protein RND81_01G017800 [Saponaria officinalis]|uniref:CID domain-containing protein n=1 Tax=Saponaria officinalis TaxID=3572 RepID=A0AAW1N8E7_SAPOF